MCRFGKGDYVKVRPENAAVRPRKPHLRTPGYLFGLVGVVERQCVGMADNPEGLAFRQVTLFLQLQSCWLLCLWCIGSQVYLTQHNRPRYRNVCNCDNTANSQTSAICAVSAWQCRVLIDRYGATMTASKGPCGCMQLTHAMCCLNLTYN